MTPDQFAAYFTLRLARSHEARTAANCHMALIHSEASEAVEAYRKRGAEAWESVSGKPEGVASELADIVIRVADLCGLMGIDLDEAIIAKLRYNATRSHRHGGKLL